MTSELHRVSVPDGSLLELACGLESLGRRFDALLAQYAPEGETLREETDERVTELMLGLVAMRAKLSATMTAAAVEPPVEGASAPSKGSWLR